MECLFVCLFVWFTAGLRRSVVDFALLRVEPALPKKLSRGMRVLLGHTPWRCEHHMALRLRLSRRDHTSMTTKRVGRRAPFRAPDTNPSLGKGARGTCPSGQVPLLSSAYKVQYKQRKEGNPRYGVKGAFFTQRRAGTEIERAFVLVRLDQHSRNFGQTRALAPCEGPERFLRAAHEIFFFQSLAGPGRPRERPPQQLRSVGRGALPGQPFSGYERLERFVQRISSMGRRG